MAGCAPLDPQSPIAPTLAAFLDCQSRSLGQVGFTGPDAGAPAALLTACLVIFVALVGYRLLSGERYQTADVVKAALRVGLVIVFCTSWKSYETVFYDVVTDAPSSLSAHMLTSLGYTPTSLEDTARGLQEVYNLVHSRLPQNAQLAQNSLPGIGPPAPGFGPAGPREFAPEDEAGLLLMISALGPALAARMAGGFLLAVGPLVIVFALFDSILGLFQGWTRALVAATLGSWGATVIAGMELNFLQAVVAPRVLLDRVPPLDPGMFITAGVFFCVTLATLAGAILVGLGLRLPRPFLSAPAAALPARAVPIPSAIQRDVRSPVVERSEAERTRSVVDSIRRYSQTTFATASSATSREASQLAAAARPLSPSSWIAPVGLAYAQRREARAPRTESVVRRNRRR